MRDTGKERKVEIELANWSKLRGAQTCEGSNLRGN